MYRYNMLSSYIYCNIFDFGRRVEFFSTGAGVSQVRHCFHIEIKGVQCVITVLIVPTERSYVPTHILNNFHLIRSGQRSCIYSILVLRTFINLFVFNYHKLEIWDVWNCTGSLMTCSTSRALRCWN